MNDILNYHFNATREEIESLGIHTLKQLTLAILTKQNKDLDYNAINRRCFELRELPFYLAKPTLESENLSHKFPPPPRPTGRGRKYGAFNSPRSRTLFTSIKTLSSLTTLNTLTSLTQ